MVGERGGRKIILAPVKQDREFKRGEFWIITARIQNPEAKRKARVRMDEIKELWSAFGTC